MRVLAISIVLALITTASAQKQPAGSNWPSFRGNHAAGAADGQNLPERWDAEAGHQHQMESSHPGPRPLEPGTVG